MRLLRRLLRTEDYIQADRLDRKLAAEFLQQFEGKIEVIENSVDE